MPYIGFCITVAAITGICTRVGHPACALTVARCSAPVRHLRGISRHPPTVKRGILKQLGTYTFILDKLFTL